MSDNSENLEHERKPNTEKFDPPGLLIVEDVLGKEQVTVTSSVVQGHGQSAAKRKPLSKKNLEQNSKSRRGCVILFSVVLVVSILSALLILVDREFRFRFHVCCFLGLLLVLLIPPMRQYLPTLNSIIRKNRRGLRSKWRAERILSRLGRYRRFFIAYFLVRIGSILCSTGAPRNALLPLLVSDVPVREFGFKGSVLIACENAKAIDVCEPNGDVRGISPSFEISTLTDFDVRAVSRSGRADSKIRVEHGRCLDCTRKYNFLLADRITCHGKCWCETGQCGELERGPLLPLPNLYYKNGNRLEPGLSALLLSRRLSFGEPLSKASESLVSDPWAKYGLPGSPGVFRNGVRGFASHTFKAISHSAATPRSVSE